jgi:tetratricopeptide (TPR) repeat protein
LRRAGQEEPNLTAILAGVYALQKKYADAESALQKVLAKPPAALKELSPTVLPFALRSLGFAYRNDRRFAKAEPLLVRLVALVMVTPGESNAQTRIDLLNLADIYGALGKYSDAEREFARLLDIQRRVSGPEVLNTIVTSSCIGWVKLQQKRHVEAEQTLREAATILARTAPQSWERSNVDSMLGASLSAQKKFDEAEPLLVSGYNGLASGKPTVSPNLTSRFNLEQAGDAILQLYTDWGKAEKLNEWKLKVLPRK